MKILHTRSGLPPNGMLRDRESNKLIALGCSPLSLDFLAPWKVENLY